MVQVLATEAVERKRATALDVLIAKWLDRGIFFGLLLLILITAVPYGTVEPWWKAIFVCLTYVLAIAWVIEGRLTGTWRTGGGTILLPLILLVGFALVQTIWPRDKSPTGISSSAWTAISADPYQTRFFALQLSALIVAGALFYRYALSRTRVVSLINVIICVAVASAVFGIIRQAIQSDLGFGLPLLKPAQGYGQFVNKNHFAFLMEMAFGLALGMLIAGRITREWVLFYAASLVPIWTALVLSNSRGGILAMLAQLAIATLLLGMASSRSRRARSRLIKVTSSWPARTALLIVLLSGVSIGTVWVGGDRLASQIEAVSNEFDPAAATRYGSSRTEIWKATWRLFLEHPMAGVGLGGYWVAISAYHDSAGRQIPQEAHSDYLELLVSGGLIGFALGVWASIAVLFRASKNLNSPDQFRRTITYAAILGITGVAIHSLVDFGLHMIVNALIFTALISMATAESDLADNKQTESL